MERAEDDRRVATHLEARAELCRSVPFPLYGLPESFTGSRALGESATTDEDGHVSIEALGLSHGSHLDTAEGHLTVITATPNGVPDPVEALAGEAGVVAVSADPPPDPTGRLARTVGPVHPIHRQIRIDDQTLEAKGLEAGASWVLQLSIGSHTVTVTGTNWPAENLTLVGIIDLDPYIAGTRRLLAGGNRES